MSLSNKIVKVKSYGFADIVDKLVNYPQNYVRLKMNNIRIKSLYKNFVQKKLPDVYDYEKRIDDRVIISLTSFPARFEQLVITLKSIILQDVTPNKIIVYLGSDTKEKDITSEMINLKKYNVEYRIDNKLNLKGHKKYYYALREFKDYLVITIDDDIIFPSTMISELLKCHQKYPNAVCARRVHKITRKNGHILPYNLWNKEYISGKKPSNRLLATTGAGTLYSPYVNNHLVNSTFDSTKIMGLCLDADDIWMKCMEIVSSIKVVRARNKLMGKFIDVDEKFTLMPNNVGQGKNDVFLKNVAKEYNIDLKLFIEN